MDVSPIPDDVTPDLIPGFYNPLIQAAYRSLAAGARVQVLWDDAHGRITGAFPGQTQFDQAWRAFLKYDAKNFDQYVSGFNEYFRPFVKED